MRGLILYVRNDRYNAADEDDAPKYFEEIQEGLHGTARDPDEVFSSDFRVLGATRALLDYVKDYGGADIRWRVVRGVTCTAEEAGE